MSVTKWVVIFAIAYVLYWIISLIILYIGYRYYILRQIKRLHAGDWVVLQSGIIGYVNHIQWPFFKITIVDGCDCTVHYSSIGDVVRDYESIKYIRHSWGSNICSVNTKG